MLNESARYVVLPCNRSSHLAENLRVTSVEQDPIGRERIIYTCPDCDNSHGGYVLRK